MGILARLLAMKADIPKDTIEVGYWHTHGEYSIERNGVIIRTADPTRDDFNSDYFSDVDLEVADYQADGKDEYKGYVGTPSGQFKGYDAKIKKQYLLEKDNE